MNELINLGNGQMVKVTMLKGERGSNIATITKTGTSGLTDTYTITLTDGSTSTFEVKNGSSIQSITKTSTVGAVDTYTITLTDGTTAGTFTVTNATGTIDQNFSASSTDPLMNKTLSGIIAGVENGSTASKTYNKNDLILRNDSLYEVQTTVASGGTWADGVNIVETTIGDLLSAVKSDLDNVQATLSDIEESIGEFTLKGSITSVNGTVTVPTTAKEVYIYGTVRSGNTNGAGSILPKRGGTTASGETLTNPPSSGYGAGYASFSWVYSTGVVILIETAGSVTSIDFKVYYR